MHEYSIVQAMFDQIERVRRQHDGLSVRRIRVAIGERAGVDPALLERAYDVYKLGTSCENARLELAHLAETEDLLLEQIELEVR